MNGRKSDRLPERRFRLGRRSAVVSCWDLARTHSPQRFEREAEGLAGVTRPSLDVLFDPMVEAVGAARGSWLLTSTSTSPGRTDRHRVDALTGIFLDAYIHPVVETFAALAEPNRFRIVELLRSGPRAVNDIGERLHLNQPQVSKHLRVLKEAGLVEVQPLAQQRLYELRSQPLRRLHAWLERYRRIWEERFEQMDELVEELEKKEKSNERRRRK